MSNNERQPSGCLLGFPAGSRERRVLTLLTGSLGHDAERHDRLLTRVELGNR